MSSSDRTAMTGMTVTNHTPSLKQTGGGEEDVFRVLCTYPLCKGDLPDDYVLVRRSLLDNFTICSRCGYAWERNKEAPKRCPNCGSYRWMNPPTQNTCLRCGHRWNSRRGTKPAKCPSCRSKNWYKTDQEMLEEEIATGMVMLEKVPEARDDGRRDDSELKEALQAAVQRCFRGEGVYSVAIDLSVPILDLILALKSEGIEVRIR